MAIPDESQPALAPGEGIAANALGTGDAAAPTDAQDGVTVSEPAPASAPTASQPTSPRVSPAGIGPILFAAAIVLLLVGYLAVAVPGPWFPSTSPLSWGPRDVMVTRGTASIEGNALVAAAGEPGGTVLISINTDIRSTDYRAIAWRLGGIPEQADVRMYWRSDYAPAKMQSVQIATANGGVLPVDVSRNPNWVGRIIGIAIAVRSPAPQPFRFASVTAKPMGAPELLRDRWREWLTFEAWTGSSMNFVAGGAAEQSLPLPFVLAAAALLAVLASFALLRLVGRSGAFPLAVGAIFLVAWIVADLRWEWNLVRQALATRDQYAGKDWQGKHLAAEDGLLFAFIQKAAAKLPPAPARVFVVAEAHYFRDRAAYHLYPHNVHFDPYRDVLPPTTSMRAGDYLLAYLRRGIQYDPGAQRLRFPDGTTLAAELLLAESGAALFVIR